MTTSRSSPARQSLQELLGLAEKQENSSPNVDLRSAGLTKQHDAFNTTDQAEAADSGNLDQALSSLLLVSYRLNFLASCELKYNL